MQEHDLRGGSELVAALTAARRLVATIAGLNGTLTAYRVRDKVPAPADLEKSLGRVAAATREMGRLWSPNLHWELAGLLPALQLGGGRVRASSAHALVHDVAQDIVDVAELILGDELLEVARDLAWLRECSMEPERREAVRRELQVRRQTLLAPVLEVIAIEREPDGVGTPQEQGQGDAAHAEMLRGLTRFSPSDLLAALEREYAIARHRRLDRGEPVGATPNPLRWSYGTWEDQAPATSRSSAPGDGLPPDPGAVPAPESPVSEGSGHGTPDCLTSLAGACRKYQVSAKAVRTVLKAVSRLGRRDGGEISEAGLVAALKSERGPSRATIQRACRAAMMAGFLTEARRLTEAGAGWLEDTVDEAG